MEEFLLRIVCINLNENLILIGKLSSIIPPNECSYTFSNNIKNIKEYYLEISEELDSYLLTIRFNALSKLLLSFIKNKKFNFVLHDNIDDNFDNQLINKAIDIGMLDDLIRNLCYFLSKLLEYPKDSLNVKKFKLIFFCKINIILIFLFLYFNKKKHEIINYIKQCGDDLEDTILKLFKLSPTYKYIPNRPLLCLHLIFIKILTSDDNEDSTFRKIEKREKYLNRNNVDKLTKPTTPKLFYNYEKSNKYIEKFYRKNILKKEKSETDRIVIVNILKILLSTTDNTNNPNSGEYIKEYIPEIFLYQHYNGNHDMYDESTEINIKNLSEIMNIPSDLSEFYSIYELINKISLTSIIIFFYLYILNCLQKYDLIQYAVFAFHLIDSNGLLVFLKILNQDYKAIDQQFIAIYDKEIINIQFGQLIECILLNNLKLIYKICYKNDDFIHKYLVECKVYIMLRKVMNNFVNNDMIKKYCLKLFKCQLKFYDKNWRIENINIITTIYTMLKLKNENQSIDNFLKYEKKDKNSKEISQDYFTFDELKKIHMDYHNFNYTRFLTSHEEYEKYQNTNHQSIYANIYLKLLNKAQIPDDFYLNYSKYNI